jgi:hypothetical protein
VSVGEDADASKSRIIFIIIIVFFFSLLRNKNIPAALFEE